MVNVKFAPFNDGEKAVIKFARDLVFVIKKLVFVINAKEVTLVLHVNTNVLLTVNLKRALNKVDIAK